LQQAAQHHAADLLIVMRVYFEKPRTTQSHRQLASGLSCPVGFKNGTDGGVKVAADAVVAARASHAFMGMTKMGQAAIFETRGNPDTHIILRGGKQPNYAAADVDAACQVLHASGLRPQIMIDVSHANSSKQHARQITVTQDVAAQVAGGDARIMGVMIESHLNEGRQDLIPGQSLQHGISITDACISLAQTPRPSTTRQTQPTWRRCAAHAHHSHASYTCVSYDTHHAKALMMRRHTAIPLFF
jgi:phospho-2-dehydro-3-deoxyheptonate aldolase